MYRYLRAGVIPLLALAMLLGVASTVSAADEEASTLEEGSGEIIVDYGPGVDPDDPEAIEAVAAMEAASAAAAASADVGTQETINAVTLTFAAANPSPANVQDVFRTAVADWSSVIDASGGPVEVEVHWFSFGSDTVLGAAGFLRAYRGGSVLPADYFTPGPLANVLVGGDINTSEPEIQVFINADFGSRWFIGTSGVPTGNQVDLYSVVLHELGHGFGFAGSAASPSQGAPPELSVPPYGYDTHVYHGNDRLLDEPNPNGLLTSNNLFFNLPDNSRHRLYAPSPWQQGSSYSHFDEATYTGDDPGALMTPRIASAEVQRTIDGAVAGVMERIGWPMIGDPPGGDATVGGTVTSTDGAGAGGIVVDLFVAADNSGTRGEWLGDTRTAADGSYQFSPVDAGCYVLTFIAPDGASFPASGGKYLNQAVCVAAGEVNLGVDATIRLGGGGDPSTIGGTITGGGGVFEGLVVDLFATNGDGSRAGWLGDATSGADGTYSFSNVDPGCYVLVFIAPDGYQMVGGNRWLEATVCIANPGDSATVNASVTPGS